LASQGKIYNVHVDFPCVGIRIGHKNLERVILASIWFPDIVQPGAENTLSQEQDFRSIAEYAFFV
jgi:hypothetical protein